MESDGFTGVFFGGPCEYHIAIPPLIALLGVARAPRRALSLGECGFHSFDPPRGRPFLVRRQSSFVGVWGRQPPRYPLHTIRIFRPDPEISGKVRITNRRFRKISGSAAKDYLKRPARDPAISKKDRHHPRPPKKSVTPHPHFPLRKKIDRSDRFQNRAGRSLLFQCHNMRFHWIF